MPAANDTPLGAYLMDRRARLDPAAFGLSGGRRRTPGLRREEVAQRASISPTWYTWLEQGRGGAPSAEVLGRIATALMLTDAEREHLYLLGLGRPPAPRYAVSGDVSPRLQRLLEALEVSPAMVKTPAWDVVAWNRACCAVLTDYGALPADERNVLLQVFLNPKVRAAQFDWEGVARFIVAAFRADTTRGGEAVKARAAQLVEHLTRVSPQFVEMWRDHAVSRYGEGVKRIRHPVLGEIGFEYSAFAVDGRPDLGMVVYNPATAEDAAAIRGLVGSR